MKVALITGATGFVGANLARHLIKKNFEVHITTRKNSNRWRLQDILSDINEHIADITNLHKTIKTIKKINPNVIYHLATYGAYPLLQRDMDKTVNTNIIGTINLIKATSKINYECFVNVGSSSEYGPKNKSLSENDLLEPISIYGAAKAAQTLFCQTTAKITQKPIVTVRPFSVYGPYEEPTRLVPYVIRNCLQGKDLKLTKGSQKRDFIFVGDFVDVLFKVSKRPDLKGEIFNAGTGKQYSVKDVVERCLQFTGSKSKTEWGKIPTRKFEVYNWVADTIKTRKILKWKPTYNIDRGLKKTIVWFKQNPRYIKLEMGLENV